MNIVAPFEFIFHRMTHHLCPLSSGPWGRSRLRRFVLQCLFLLLAAWALQAQAQTSPTVQVQSKPPSVEAVLTQMLVTVENGKEVLKPVEGVKPGDLIEYRVVYTNRTTQPVRDMQATLPIPQGLEYQPRSAQPAQTVEAAVRGGSYAREPLMRDLGNGKKEAIPYHEYRSLRWAIAQIPAAGKAEVQARVRVASGTSLNVSLSAPATSAGR